MAYGFNDDKSRVSVYESSVVDATFAKKIHTILGQYNIDDPNEDYAIILGNGTSDNDKSNAMAIDWDGVYKRFAPGMSASSIAANHTYYDISEIYDGDGARRGFFQAADRTDGKQGIALRAQRLVSGNTVFNGFNMYIAGDGTRTVEFNDAAAWRNALGKWDDHFNITRSDIDFTKADNNVSSNQYPHIIFTDQSGTKVGARFENIVQADGKVGFFIYAKNYNTSGTDQGTKGIKLLMDKSGNTAYTVSDAANFCSAINVGTLTVKDQSAAVSMAASAWTNVCSVSLPAGTYVMAYNIHYESSGGNVRFAGLATNSSGDPSASMKRHFGVEVSPAGSNFPTYVNGSGVLVLSSTTTVYLRGYHNNGTAINVYGHIDAIRIK